MVEGGKLRDDIMIMYYYGWACEDNISLRRDRVSVPYFRWALKQTKHLSDFCLRCFGHTLADKSSLTDDFALAVTSFKIFFPSYFTL